MRTEKLIAIWGSSGGNLATHLTLALAFLMASPSALWSQDPTPPPLPATVARLSQAQDSIALGEALFLSPLLSEGDGTSCATCHDPNRSFVDGRADAIGEGQIGIGRNSPTLFAMSAIKLFRDPDQARFAKPGKRPQVLDLEERCLAPMENELEMGSAVGPIVKKLNRIQIFRDAFDRAFKGSRGVTKKRLGTALGDFIRSLDPPQNAPYARFLDGDEDALAPAARRGLAIFQGIGNCNACHSGTALSDGLMHVVDPPKGQRIRDRERVARERRLELFKREALAKGEDALVAQTIDLYKAEASGALRRLPGGGGYDPSQVEVQTTTLWDVARTGPYFRDGSVTKLEEVVRVHIQEMRTVAESKQLVDTAVRDAQKHGKGAAQKLRPRKKVARDMKSAPQVLNLKQMEDLLAFLRALSPEDTPGK